MFLRPEKVLDMGRFQLNPFPVLNRF